MFGRPNVVVGRGLIEFLSLGCRFGYFELDQLAYEPAETIDAIQRGRADDPEGHLVALRDRLALSPCGGRARETR